MDVPECPQLFLFRSPAETGFPLSAVVAPGYYGEVGSLQQATGLTLAFAVQNLTPGILGLSFFA